MDIVELNQVLQVVVPITGIVFGTLLAGYIFSKIIGLIKTWINRSKSQIHDEDFDRLAKAFMKHKKDSDRRIRNLETIIANEGQEIPESTESAGTLEASERAIEIEDAAPKKNEAMDQNSNLRNMLRE